MKKQKQHRADPLHASLVTPGLHVLQLRAMLSHANKQLSANTRPEGVVRRRCTECSFTDYIKLCRFSYSSRFRCIVVRYGEDVPELPMCVPFNYGGVIPFGLGF